LIAGIRQATRLSNPTERHIIARFARHHPRRRPPGVNHGGPGDRLARGEIASCSLTARGAMRNIGPSSRRRLASRAQRARMSSGQASTRRGPHERGPAG
jgi:hypothetical protein